MPKKKSPSSVKSSSSSSSSSGSKEDEKSAYGVGWALGVKGLETTRVKAKFPKQAAKKLVKQCRVNKKISSTSKVSFRMIFTKNGRSKEFDVEGQMIKLSKPVVIESKGPRGGITLNWEYVIKSFAPAENRQPYHSKSPKKKKSGHRSRSKSKSKSKSPLKPRRLQNKD